jgi:hypothetical protein
MRVTGFAIEFSSFDMIVCMRGYLAFERRADLLRDR